MTKKTRPKNWLASVVLSGLFLGLGLTGCASLFNAPVKNEIAAVEVGLKSLNNAAFEYVSLPLCGKPQSPILCSKPAVIGNIGKAASSAYTAITAAEASLSVSDLAKAKLAFDALKKIITVDAGIKLKE